MRLHALRVQGLRAPRGIEAIPLHPEYTAVRGDADAVRAVADVLLALLDPEHAIERLLPLRDPDSDAAPRLALTLQLGPGVYRIAVDLDERKLVLARHDPENDRFVRVARAPDAARQILAAEGSPDSTTLQTLAHLSLQPPEEPPIVEAPVETPVETERARVDQLAAELSEIEEAVRVYAPLVQSDENWRERIAHYRAAREECDRDLETLDRTRHELLEERARLRAGRPTRTPWFWLGGALVTYGVAAGLFVDPLVSLLAVVGLVLVAATSAGTGSRRRRLRRLEARVSALNMRERTVEKRFESEAKPVRTFLVALDLGHIDELERAIDDLRDLEIRVEAARLELEAALESASARPVRAGRPPGDARLRALVAAASVWTGETPKEIHAQVRQMLSVYLPSMSVGAVRALVSDDETGEWSVRDESGLRSFATLPSETRMQVEIAFQLALVERIATVRPLPAIVGPPPPGVGEPIGLAAALARLARVHQIVQFTEGLEPWRPVAPRVHVIGDVPAADP